MEIIKRFIKLGEYFFDNGMRLMKTETLKVFYSFFPAKKILSEKLKQVTYSPGATLREFSKYIRFFDFRKREKRLEFNDKDKTGIEEFDLAGQKVIFKFVDGKETLMNYLVDSVVNDDYSNLRKGSFHVLFIISFCTYYQFPSEFFDLIYEIIVLTDFENIKRSKNEYFFNNFYDKDLKDRCEHFFNIALENEGEQAQFKGNIKNKQISENLWKCFTK
jgi:hypothetical protein